jgi:hypothetical protein
MELSDIYIENPSSKNLIPPSTPRVPDSYNWSYDSECLCEKIRANSAILAKHHKKYYIHLKERQKMFKVPIIILGSVNTVLSISLEEWTKWASVIICVINLLLTIISSLEMFLGIHKNIENNYILQREYYILSIEIYKTLQQTRQNRVMKGNEYLNKLFLEYNKLFEMSSVNRQIEDKLLPLNDNDNISPDSSIVHEETGV